MYGFNLGLGWSICACLACSLFIILITLPVYKYAKAVGFHIRGWYGALFLSFSTLSFLALWRQ